MCLLEQPHPYIIKRYICKCICTYVSYKEIERGKGRE